MTLSEFKVFNSPNQNISSIAFSSDSQQLITLSHMSSSSSYSEILNYWALNGQPSGESIALPKDEFHELISGPNGKPLIFNTTGYGYKRLKGLEDGELIASFLTGGLAYGIFSPDGKYIAVESSGGFVIIDIANQQTVSRIKGSVFDSNVPIVVRFSPENNFIATGSFDDTIYLWDINGKQLAKFKANQGGVKDIVFSSDSEQLITLGEDGTLRMWGIPDGKQLIKRISLDSDVFNEVSISSNNQILATNNEQGIVQLWSLRDQKLSELFLGYSNLRVSPESTLNFSPDGSQVAVREIDGTIHLLDLKNNQEPISFVIERTSAIFGSHVKKNYYLSKEINFSKDSNLLAIGGDNIIAIYDRNGQELIELSESPPRQEGDLMPQWVEAMDFDPSGNLLASAALDGSVRLWSWKERRQVLPEPINASTGEALSVAFNPEGNLIATAGSDGWTSRVRLWNLAGERMAEFEGHIGLVGDVIFSPNGKLIATAGSDGTARIWDLSGQQLAQFGNVEQQGSLDQVRSVEFSKDGKQLTFVYRRYGEDFLPGYWHITSWPIEDLSELFKRGCEWAREYLENNLDLNKRDRSLCDGVDRVESISSEFYMIPDSISNEESHQSLHANGMNSVESSPSNSPRIFDRGAIRFSSGETSATVNGSLSIGSLDRYTFDASSGQTARLLAESAEDEISLSLFSPNGNPLPKDESNSWSGILPESGTYTVAVMSNQKNISNYRLKLEIEP
jgi:WD40 repeat protein